MHFRTNGRGPSVTLLTQSDGLTFDPMGGDEVSKVVAKTVHDSAHDPQFGLVPKLRKAALNLREGATNYRTKAKAYGYTEESNAQGFGSAG